MSAPDVEQPISNKTVWNVCRVAAVHDRMPVILDPATYDLWLDPAMSSVSEVSELLEPFDAGLMRRYPVRTRVNSTANDDEECCRFVELAETQNRLFASRDFYRLE